MLLGADVTVMLYAQRALMTGAGEHVEALPADRPPLIVVPLEAELSAGQVYAEFDARDRARTPEELEAAAPRDPRRRALRARQRPRARRAPPVRGDRPRAGEHCARSG